MRAEQGACFQSKLLNKHVVKVAIGTVEERKVFHPEFAEFPLLNGPRSAQGAGVVKRECDFRLRKPAFQAANSLLYGKTPLRGSQLIHQVHAGSALIRYPFKLFDKG